jgi:hypothetical protein
VKAPATGTGTPREELHVLDDAGLHIRAEVGRDAGRSILRFDHLFDEPPSTVWLAVAELTGRAPSWPKWGGPRCTVALDGIFLEEFTAWGSARWEVDPLAGRSYVTLTVSLDEDDVDAVANAGARYQRSFEELVRQVTDPGHVASGGGDHRAATLERRYGDAIAAALADAD